LAKSLSIEIVPNGTVNWFTRDPSNAAIYQIQNLAPRGNSGDSSQASCDGKRKLAPEKLLSAKHINTAALRAEVLVSMARSSLHPMLETRIAQLPKTPIILAGGVIGPSVG
jgi:hypothetical protein